MHDLADVFDIYEKLWRRGERDGAVVNYYTSFDFYDKDRLTSDQNGATGWFDANVDDEKGQPIVLIYRLACDDDISVPSRIRGPDGAHLPTPDLFSELITLAHEYGHLRSFLSESEREEWKQYNEAAQRRAAISKRTREQSHGLIGIETWNLVREALRVELTDDDCERIIREESFAWKIGREVLAELQMTDFRKYDNRREHGLHAHRYRLGREDAWPTDLEGFGATE